MFFHWVANSHKKFNDIISLLVDKELTRDPKTMSNYILQFYKHLYFKDDSQRP